jgi:glycosyltransferase involved in cell wall biosynthesis
MSLVEFEEVVQLPLDGERLAGFFLDHPRGGASSEASAVDVWGWVLGRSFPAVAVEIVHGGRVIRRAPVNVRRPDVASAYPDVAGAEFSGFQTTLRMLGVVKTELGIRAVLKDQTRIDLASIRARGRWRGGDSELPLVSVVIPCFNHAHYLSEAIESVLAQSYPHLEVVVVDDGSTDNTSEVASRYPGVRLVQQSNQGPSAARNTGIRQSNGDYLIFLDADDRLLSNCVEAGLECFRRHPESAFVSGRARVVASDGSAIGDRPPADMRGDPFLAMLRHCYVYGTGTVLYRRSALDQAKGFCSAMAPCEDFDLYLRIARVFPVSSHDTLVAEYRWHGANTSRQAALMLQTGLRVLRSQWKYVRASRAHRRAYRDGVRGMVEWGGKLVVSDIQTALREGGWRQALRDLWVLSRCDPRGFARVILGGLR